MSSKSNWTISSIRLYIKLIPVAERPYPVIRDGYNYASVALAEWLSLQPAIEDTFFVQGEFFIDAGGVTSRLPKRPLFISPQQSFPIDRAITDPERLASQIPF